VPSTADPERVDVEGALDVLAVDGLVAFPTETVWGLAARVESPVAVARLRAFKGRDDDKPMSVLVDSIDRLAALGVRLGPRARRLVETFWPGPLTLVAHCSRRFAEAVSPPASGDAEGGAEGEGALLAVGFRCSSHPIAAALARGALERGLGPVTATSLNRSGEDPASVLAEALRVAAKDPGVVVCHGEAGGEAPSTVVYATGRELTVLREGAIPASDIQESLAPMETSSR
jgi:L-threonylcarbamoyladenylate synthase